jgi:trans-aconitate 2-methyltransferase
MIPDLPDRALAKRAKLFDPVDSRVIKGDAQALALGERLDDDAGEAVRRGFHQRRVPDRERRRAVRQSLEQAVHDFGQAFALSRDQVGGARPNGVKPRRSRLLAGRTPLRLLVGCEPGHHRVIGQRLLRAAKDPGGRLRRSLRGGYEHHGIVRRQPHPEVFGLRPALSGKGVGVLLAHRVPEQMDLLHGGSLCVAPPTASMRRMRPADHSHQPSEASESSTAREWDAATYDRIADPQVRWATKLFDHLELRGGERLLDAGCGSGRVTELLLERLPRGTVVALDASERMLEEARRRLGGDHRVEFVHADLAQPLPIAEPVDAVFSNATFHWVTDHDALFRTLAAAMRPGARIVAQCGGEGNIASITEALRQVGDDWTGHVYFASPEETRQRMAASGFVDVECWLHDEPTEFEPGEPFETFLSTVVLRAHLARLPPSEQRAFVGAVIERLPEPVIDYVRLNIIARRAAD